MGRWQCGVDLIVSAVADVGARNDRIRQGLARLRSETCQLLHPADQVSPATRKTFDGLLVCCRRTLQMPPHIFQRFQYTRELIVQRARPT